MYYRYYTQYVYDILRKLGPLHREQVKQYVMIMTDTESDEDVNNLINNMIKKEMIYNKGNIVMMNPLEDPDREMLIATWVYLQLAPQSKACFYAADYPSKIGLAVNDQAYLITVCDNGIKDNNMIALANKRKDPDVQHIIIGNNVKHSQLNPDYYPDTKYSYVELPLINVFDDVISNTTITEYPGRTER